jgi:hypothetical protein
MSQSTEAILLKRIDALIAKVAIAVGVVIGSRPPHPIA